MPDMRIGVTLSVTRALLELVAADLRGVAVAIEGSKEQGSVDVRFLYEGEVGELQAECASLAGTYVTADFPPTVVVNDRAVPNATLDLLPGEFFVFRRWEPDNWQGDEVLGRRLK